MATNPSRRRWPRCRGQWGLMSHPLTWLYRRLGARSPAIFSMGDLATAFVVGTGAVALFGFYYNVSGSDFVEILAITLGLTAVSISIVLVRVLKRLRPLSAWIAGHRSSEQTAEAWRLAVDMPMELIRRNSVFPILVALIAVVGSMIILELSWLAFLPLMTAALLSVAYAAIVHYLALE